MPLVGYWVSAESPLVLVQSISMAGIASCHTPMTATNSGTLIWSSELLDSSRLGTGSFMLGTLGGGCKQRGDHDQCVLFWVA